MSLVVWVPLQPFRAWPFISGVTSKRKEVDSYLLFPMRDMRYTWRCIPENLKLSPYVIFSYFSVCLFVCLYRATMVEQCNNNLKHFSKYLLPLKITVVNFSCVISPVQCLSLILSMFVFLMSCSFKYPIAPIFFV